MKEAMFEELKESIRQAGAIRRGQLKPAKITQYPEPNVKKIRNQLDLSQSQFATLLGISIGTLQGWEQERRKPQGPARVLLQIAEKHPEVVFEVNQMKYQTKAS
ncbi:MAG: helix-turn-helix domain-containing protein [SAR324 cluster bacterium]|nr:helix-turn-helix domain-containing protein [SAR324 cluster bacterium]